MIVGSSPALGRVLDAVRKASEDPEVRVLVITGAGRGFCSGGDVKRMNERKDNEQAYELEDRIAAHERGAQETIRRPE